MLYFYDAIITDGLAKKSEMAKQKQISTDSEAWLCRERGGVHMVRRAFRDTAATQ